jgi:hypothetical protein
MDRVTYTYTMFILLMIMITIAIASLVDLLYNLLSLMDYRRSMILRIQSRQTDSEIV